MVNYSLRTALKRKIFSSFYRRKNYSATTFLTQIFFPEGTQPSSKITEIPGSAGGYDTYPLGWTFQGGGGSKAKVPSVGGGIDIFWNYTILSRYFPGGGSLCTSSPWNPDGGMKRPHCHSILESLLTGYRGDRILPYIGYKNYRYLPL